MVQPVHHRRSQPFLIFADNNPDRILRGQGLCQLCGAVAAVIIDEEYLVIDGEKGAVHPLQQQQEIIMLVIGRDYDSDLTASIVYHIGLFCDTGGDM